MVSMRASTWEVGQNVGIGGLGIFGGSMMAYIGYRGGEGWFGRIVFGSEEAVHG